MKIKKILIVLLILLVSLTLFSACKKDPPEEPSLSLIQDGTPNFRVIVPGNRPAMAVNCGEKIVNAINQKYGTSLEVEDDFNAADPFNKEKVSNNDIEILIGATNRVESDGIASSLNAINEWYIKTVGNKVIIYASEADTYLAAASFFVETFVNSAPVGTLNVTLNYERYGKLYEDNPLWNELLTRGATVLCKEDATERTVAATAELAARLTESLCREVTGAKGDTAAGVPIRIATDSNMGFYDYKILYADGAYTLSAGSSAALDTACDNLIKLILDEKLTNGEYSYRFDMSGFNSLCTDPSTFVPNWKDRVTVPAWMTDFEEKIAAMFATEGPRPLLLSHGRAGYLYPDNSLENALSNILLGADILEMDVYHTKDNVIIMCHNSTLKGTTNVEDFMGKPGYPRTATISDWTYEQLQDLSMIMNDGTVTPYKVPTLYEVLLLTRGRCFVMIDKKDEWVTTEDVLELAVETDSLECFFYSMFLKEESGYTGMNTVNYFVVPYLKEHPENTRLQKYCDMYRTAYNRAGGNYPSRSWALQSGTGGTYKETETFEDYERVVKKKGEHIIIWTNQMDLASLYISRYYQAVVKK